MRSTQPRYRLLVHLQASSGIYRHEIATPKFGHLTIHYETSPEEVISIKEFNDFNPKLTQIVVVLNDGKADFAFLSRLDHPKENKAFV